MTEPDPEQPDLQELAERDRATVLNCDHGAIELTTNTLKYPNGPVQIDVLTCLGCPTTVILFHAEDPRDDIYARAPLGN